MNPTPPTQHVPTTLAVYVHVPFCRAKCPYCAFYSVPLAGRDVPRFLDALLHELDLHAPAEPIVTLYLGGGSPSCLDPQHLLDLTRRLTDRLGRPAELTLEINPGQLPPGTLARLRKLGINRFSIGVQSFHPDDLRMLGRPYDPQVIQGTVAAARAAGFDNLGFDLIYAIPHSSLSRWRETLYAALDLQPRHISAYSLTYEPPSRFHELRRTSQLTPIDEDADRAMYDLAVETLEAAGLKQYEISNFAQPGYECRHNLTYWANRPWLGLGPAAASWYRGARTANLADLDAYLTAVEAGRLPIAHRETPDPDALACETAVLMLRRTRGIDLAEFRQLTGRDPLALFAPPIARYRLLGLLEAHPDRLCLAPHARPIADSILCDFASF